ncbi:HNH endonuclease [Desulfobacter sp.]|uniref:HNH endonuclease n=1 Tax=Desulfobacter sp. TaxID=2294 RepID=UPI0025807369|nr:HNH endonuclease [Desulfobacter sp.]
MKNSGDKNTVEMFEKAFDIYNSKSTNISPLLDLGMNESSANMTLTWFDKIFSGQFYKRSMSYAQAKFILNKLYNSNENERLGRVLQSFSLYVEHYQPKKITKLVNQFKEKFETLESPNICYPEELLEEDSFYEGAKTTVTVNSYERNPKARLKCIERYGLSCAVCKINFENVYGNIGKDFIHVHHLTPVSSVNKEYRINPESDLRPVCPNCHAMLHKKKPPYSIEELKNKIERKNA